VVASIFASAGILTLGWQLGTAGATPAVRPGATASGTTGTATPSAAPAPSAPTASGATGSPTSGSSPSASSPSASASAAPAAPSGSGLKSGTFTGDSAQTPFGNVQVQLTIVGGKITEVKALQLTNEGGRSVEISNYAAPILRQEVLAAQSANVDNVNGATYTTDGYLTSVQSALDKAKA
jgi:uncharacterized protein with FMN-binding domain